MLLHVFHFAAGLVFTWLAFSTLYILIFSLLAHFYLDSSPGSSANRKIAVVITGNNENKIMDTLVSLKNQSYPYELFDIAVVTGSTQPIILSEPEKSKVRFIKTGYVSTSEKISRVLETLPDIYDLAVILEDNSSVGPDFLLKVNQGLYPYMKVLQCHCTSEDTNIALKGVICEEINNQIFRKGQRSSGFSASLSGSGMVFNYMYLKNLLTRHHSDEELDLKLIADKNTIYYLDEALVYEDYLQNKASFRKWFATRFLYFKTNFIKDIVTSFRTRNTDLLNKALQMAVLPVSTLLSSLIIIDFLLIGSGAITSFSAVNKMIKPGLNAWFLLLVITGFSVIISVPRKFFRLRTLKGLVMNLKLRNI